MGIDSYSLYNIHRYFEQKVKNPDIWVKKVIGTEPEKNIQQKTETGYKLNIKNCICIVYFYIFSFYILAYLRNQVAC